MLVEFRGVLLGTPMETIGLSLLVMGIEPLSSTREGFTHR
jgi:hypothetical protein